MCDSNKRINVDEKTEKMVIKLLVQGATAGYIADLLEIPTTTINDIIKYDQAKRLAYINREMAIMDYNSTIRGAREEGEKKGEQKGEKKGEKKGKQKILKLFAILRKEKKDDDFDRALYDDDYLEQLLAKYHIE